MLKKLRGKKSIDEVSSETGITVRSLRAYEQGYRVPSDKNKIVLSKYYKKSIEDIFFRENYTNSE